MGRSDDRHLHAVDRRQRYQNLLPRDVLERKLPRFQVLADLAMERMEATPGVYLLRAGTQRHLYAGETLSLRERLRRKLEAFKPWAEISKEIQIGVFPFGDADRHWLLGFQSNLIKEREPDLNYLKLGVA
jgi:hypothetical protein